ncbi:MAG: hypothetical protein L0Y79_00280 [Chlorobi bacterium]|nr:hypothetical protein [Chlorobiota bacterium]MCI0716935.1 hypothetical protein [Chlorobiota bacterium]
MIFFKTKITQEQLALGVFNFVKNADLEKIAQSIFSKEISSNHLKRFIRAELYIIILTTIKYYKDKNAVVHYLLYLIYEEFYLNEYSSYAEFQIFFNSDFKEFQEMMEKGKRIGQGTLYGISYWVLNEPTGEVDPITQVKITEYLLICLEEINKMHEKFSKRIKLID